MSTTIAINDFPQHTSLLEADLFVISSVEEEALVTFDAMVDAMASAISADTLSGVPPVATTSSELDETTSTVWLYLGDDDSTFSPELTNGYIYYYYGSSWVQGNYYGAADTATDAEVSSIVSIIEGA